MKTTRPSTFVAILSAAACAALMSACAGAPAGTPGPATGPAAGTTPGATRFAYRVPSNPDGLYHIEDSLFVGVSTPVGDMEVMTTTQLSMRLRFGRDPGGIGVVGTVMGFNAVSANSRAGIRTADADDIAGPCSLVLSPGGHVEVATMPVLDTELADLSPFPGIAFEIFPRLPAYPVGPGDSWVDTVSWYVVDEVTASTTNTIYRYTLVGDTVLGDRTLLKFDVTGEVSKETVQGEEDEQSTQEMTGTITGFVLWDTEFGLPAYVESHREMEGTNSVPGAGTIRMTISGPVRITAVFQPRERRRIGGG
ncbi:MAG: hypothetical protein F4176_11545 [Acidimicrobiia bacterium]|nr:hypothetical protein [Acidimicrobiia bacterium]